MSFPTSEQLPPDPNASLSPARRRRKRRNDAAGAPANRGAFLQEMVRRVTPSADFFFYSLISGFILAAAVLLDAPALFVMAALTAPYLTPVAGLSVAAAIGSFQVFFQSLGALISGSLLVFAGGAAAGLVSRFAGFSTLAFQVEQHTRFTWPDFALLTMGAVLTTYLISRSPRRHPGAVSAALAYELYLPVGAAGYGLVANRADLLTGGLLIFAAYLGWAVLVGAVTLFLLGFRPFNLVGLVLSVLLGLAAVAAVLLFSGIGTALIVPPAPVDEFLNPQPLVSTTVPTRKTMSLGTPQPATATCTPTNTLVPSRTPTVTVSPRPTPIYARINAGEYNGALVRAEPDPTSPVVKSLLNNMLVEVLPVTKQNGAVTWVRVRTTEGIEGWIVRGLLVTATPLPNH